MMLNTRHILMIGVTIIVALWPMASSAHAAAPSTAHDKALKAVFSQSFAPQTIRHMPRNAPRFTQRQISPSDAKAIARRKVPGAEVVDINRNGDTYRVRLIQKDGRVVDVFIDAATGRVKK